MPTIKTKKEMNLAELIEWAWEYGLKEITFYSINDDRGVAYEASFDDDDSFYSNDEINPEIIFIVEVEEEITEDTKLFKLYHLTEYSFWEIKLYRSINDVKTDKSLAFYIINDDMTMTLIWTKEKGLVE